MRKHFTTSTRKWLLTGVSTLLLGLGLAGTCPIQAQAQVPTWQQAFGSSNQATADSSAIQSMAADAAGNVFVAGWYRGRLTLGSTTLISASTTTRNVFAAKWSPSANAWSWATSFNELRVHDLAVGNSSVYLAYSSSTASATMAKLVDNGTTVSTAWSFPLNAGINSVAVSGTSVYLAGNFVSSTTPGSPAIVIAGQTVVSNSNTSDIYLAKYTDQGSTVANGWLATLRGSGSEGAALVTASGSSVYLGGLTGSSGATFSGPSGQSSATLSTSDTSNGLPDPFVAKFTDNGSSATYRWSLINGDYYNVERPYGLATNGSSVYMVGRLPSLPGNTSITLAGTALTSVGSGDMFLAKYIDNGSSYTNGGAVSGGGTSDDFAYDVAVSGTDVYVAGRVGRAAATIAGTTLGGTGRNREAFLAKYVDQGSAGLANGWALDGGSTVDDEAYALALGLTGVYIGGFVTGPATFGTQNVSGRSSAVTFFMATTAPAAALAPAVASFTPATGEPGTSVALTGTGMANATGVSFNGVAAAAFTINSATSITAIVPAGATTGTISATSAAGTGTSVGSFTVRQPRAGRILLDGYREVRYGAARAVQTAGTQFGNATNGSAVESLGGSELDAAYVRVSGDSLFVFIAGNLQNNRNVVDIFFDTKAGGQNVLASTNSSVDNNGLNNMAGLTFDPSFAADYYLNIRDYFDNGYTDLRANFAVVGFGGGSAFSASTSSGVGRTALLDLGSGRIGRFAANQSNTGGVDDASAYGAVPAGVVTGIEFMLPLPALGAPLGNMKVAAFINSPTHTFVSNQVLGGLPAGTGNLQNPNSVDFGNLAGDQFFGFSFPTITALSATAAPGGSTITISGVNLSTATAVSFNGVLQNTITNNTGTSLTVTVPNNANTGPLWVVTPTGTTNSLLFNVVDVQLAVTQNGTAYANGGSTYNFGTQAAGTTSAPASFSLANAGTTALAVSNVTVTGDFILTTTAPTTVAAGGTAAVSVAFAPTTSGLRTGTLVITSTLGTYTVNLSGTGQVATPVIGNLSVTSGTAGTTVTLTGTNLTGATSVTLNGVVITGFTVVNATTITFTIPAGATSGPITVTTPGGTSTGVTFTVMAPQLAVAQGSTSYTNGGTAYSFGAQVVNTTSAATSFTLTNAGTAPLTITSITTTGNFAVSGTAPTSVAAGGTASVSATFTPTTTGTRTGTLVITSSLGTYTVNLTGNGQVAAPVLASLSPTSGLVGTTVTITGTNLAGATSVSFNGTTQATITNNTAGSLTVVVPTGATTGLVTVTTPGGTSPGLTFTVTAPQLALTQGSTSYPNAGTAYSFGAQVVNTTSAAVSFTLTNAGTAPLTITGATTTGDFALIGTPPTSIAAGGSNPVNVTFTPTATGTRPGTLVITSDLGTYTVNLTGNGQAPTPAPVIGTLSSASGAVGSTVTITGTNLTGATSLTLNGVVITNFTVVNNTTITFVIPAGATSGPLVLTTPAGTSTGTVSFCVQYAATATGVSRCGTGSVTLTASGAPTGGSYAWYDAATGGTAISGATTGSYATPSLTATTPYYVSIVTGSGSTACEGPRTLVSATINAAPTVNIASSGTTSFCQGGSVTLTATGADTYLWSTGATTASITVTAAGSYTVTGTTTAGCSAASAATPVSVEPLPARPVITQGAAGTLSSSAATGNQWYLSGTAIPGATGATYVVASPAGNGNYTVVTTSATGCASPPSAAVAVVISGTTRSTLLAGLQVLPNPAHDHATVLLPRLPGAPATLELVDALGRVVLTQPVVAPATGQQALRLTGLATGIYALRLTVDGTTATRRLMVE